MDPRSDSGIYQLSYRHSVVAPIPSLIIDPPKRMNEKPFSTGSDGCRNYAQNAVVREVKMEQTEIQKTTQVPLNYEVRVTFPSAILIVTLLGALLNTRRLSRGSALLRHLQR